MTLRHFISAATAALTLLCSQLHAEDADCWVTLGTAGGPPIHPDQAQISNAVVSNGAVYLFDVGNGVLRQMTRAGLAIRQLAGVFLSHHHPDHNAELGNVMTQWWTFGDRPVPVIGPAGTATMVTDLASANAATELASFPTGGRPAKPPMQTFFEVTEKTGRFDAITPVFKDANIRVSLISVDHFQTPPSIALETMPEALAFRIEACGKVYVYSGDTGRSANLVTLAEGADILVSEVVDTDAILVSLSGMLSGAPAGTAERMASAMLVNHMLPEVVGDTASQAGVGQVVLTHFVPASKDQPSAAELIRRVESRYSGPVSAAQDLDRY